jgi:uncharacterized protein (DUF2237 family)
MEQPFNVLGNALQPCSCALSAGYFRDGLCRTVPSDRGKHVVCAVMTDEFLEFTKAHGNDLSTARPGFRFPGLKVGDQWCLCAERWKEAWMAGTAPPVVLAACEQSALQIIPLEILQQHQTDPHD